MGILRQTIGKPQNRYTNPGQNYIGAPSFSHHNPGIFNWYKNPSYSSSFPSIRAITNEYMAVMPYAIDANGQKIGSEIIDALFHPNQSDSVVSFSEKICVSTLVLPKTYILVWRKDGDKAEPGGDFRYDTIAGFTFLEFPAITRMDGKTYYRIGSQEFNEDEVISLPGGVNPYDLYAGYSPSEAARRWLTLDDYMADFQSGFFENNAIPAGQFVITAPTTKEYNDIVDMLQSRHRGAGNNNNVTYAHRPVDPNTGSPTNAQIEWIAYQQSNKDIDFKNLFEQANARIDTTYGVPKIVKGVDDAATYANAQVAEKTFAKRAVYPQLLRNYTQLNHELNRITGGTGIAITFTYTIPTVADEEKVEAETKNIHTTIINNLTDKGYSLDSIVDALQLPSSYKDLKLGDSSAGNSDEDEPEVDEGDEVDDSPDPDKIDGVSPLNITIKNSTSDYDKLYAVARGTMKRQVDEAVRDIREEDIQAAVNPEPTEEEKNQFIDDMMGVIAGILVTYGFIQWELGKELLENNGLDTDNLGDYVLDEDADTRYRNYLNKVATSYMDDNANAIRNVLAEAKVNQWSVNDTKKVLRGIMDTDEWRVKRLADTETVRSEATGGIESMRDIKSKTGYEIEKGLIHTGSDSPCEFCATLLNRWVAVDKEFIIEGETITGTEGGMYLNNFAPNDGYDVHPNGHCVPQYRIATGSVSNKYKEKINSLEKQLAELDGRTKEAKDLRQQVTELENYITQLEGIVDGQG